MHSNGVALGGRPPSEEVIECSLAHFVDFVHDNASFASARRVAATMVLISEHVTNAVSTCAVRTLKKALHRVSCAHMPRLARRNC